MSTINGVSFQTRSPATTSNSSGGSCNSSDSGNGRIRIMRRNPYDSVNPWVPVAPSPIAIEDENDISRTSTNHSRSSSKSSLAPSPMEPLSVGACGIVPITASTAHSNCIALPHGETPRHTDIVNRVTYVPYSHFKYMPRGDVQLPVPMGVATQRLFFGQLPYNITPSLLAGIVYEVSGCFLLGTPEIIAARSKSKDGARSTAAAPLAPTGCAHALCATEQVHTILEAMHKQVLIDETGLWIAKDADQLQCLRNYCRFLHTASSQRFPGLPCDTVCAQIATSQYHSQKTRRPSSNASLSNAAVSSNRY